MPPHQVREWELLRRVSRQNHRFRLSAARWQADGFVVASNYLRATSRLSERLWSRRRRSFSLILLIIATTAVCKDAEGPVPAMPRRSRIDPQSFDLTTPCPLCGYKIPP